ERERLRPRIANFGFDREHHSPHLAQMTSKTSSSLRPLEKGYKTVTDLFVPDPVLHRDWEESLIICLSVQRLPVPQKVWDRTYPQPQCAGSVDFLLGATVATEY